MTHNAGRWLAAVLLTVGFLLGRGVARALDLGAVPAPVQATTTQGLNGALSAEVPPQPAARQSAVLSGDPAPAVTPTDPAAMEPAPDDDGEEQEGAPVGLAPAPPADTKRAPRWLTRALGGLKHKGHAVVAPFEGSLRATSLDPSLQSAARHLLEDYDVPAGAVVMMDPRSGKVLAMAAHSENGRGNELAAEPLAPAASVFKIVTGAALLEKGVKVNEQVCYSGGKRRVRARDLRRVAQGRGRVCVTFEQAMARSANIPFAHLTQSWLQPQDLTRWANRFMFNQPLPLGQVPSRARIPQGGLEFYQAGAGFGDVRMSALHGALLASTVAAGGVMPKPQLWADQAPAAVGQVMPAQSAERIGQMMQKTVTEGTARRAFRERRRYTLGSIPAAGKTGSLAEKGPFRDYSWFVGYAPADNPTVVVSTFVMNGPRWRIRAAYVGREMLRTALVEGHRPYRPVVAVAQQP